MKVKWYIKNLSLSLITYLLLLSCTQSIKNDSKITHINSISGIWEGSYIASLSNIDRKSIPKGPLCIELNSERDKLTGKIWIGGYTWDAKFNGSIRNNSLKIYLKGETLKGKSLNINIEGTYQGNTINGTLSIGNKTYELYLKKIIATKCNYVTEEKLIAFYNTLTLNGNYQEDMKNNTLNEEIINLISLMTGPQSTNIRVSTEQANLHTDWWANIWEIRDKINGYTKTLGAIMHLDKYSEGNIKFLIWNIEGKELSIGLNENKEPVRISRNLKTSKISELSIDSAIYAEISKGSSSKYIIPDGKKDKYINKGTKIVSTEPYFVSECKNNRRIKAWKVSIPFFITIEGKLIINKKEKSKGILEAPTYISQTTSDLISIYVEFEKCNS